MSRTRSWPRMVALAIGAMVFLFPFYTEVTCRVTRETPAEQGFHGFRGWVFWLLQGEWDRCVKKFEGLPLGGSGYREQVEAGLVVAGDAEVVAGQGAEVVQQGGEAAGGLVVGGGLGRRLGISCVGALGGGDRVGGLGPVLVGERQRRPSLA